MNKVIKLFISLMPILLCSFAHSNQLCDGETVTLPTERFVIGSENDQFVVDSITGLAWARCLIGQTWDSTNQTCSGEAERLSWQEALQTAKTFQVSNHTDWRVPNLKELASIVERQCVSPATNLEIFPNSTVDRYWSSTPNTSASKVGEAWAVAFYNGRIDSHDKLVDFYVRMVRFAE